MRFLISDICYLLFVIVLNGFILTVVELALYRPRENETEIWFNCIR